MLDKMSARCTALSVDSGAKKYIDGACVLADADGDKIFSTFDTRDLDKSQPDMNCGTHIITGGTGKYKGITGSEPFACNALPHWPVAAATRRWTSRTTRRGRSRTSDPKNPPQMDEGRLGLTQAGLSSISCSPAHRNISSLGLAGENDVRNALTIEPRVESCSSYHVCFWHLADIRNAWSHFGSEP